MKFTWMSLTNGLGSEKESIILCVRVVHFESFGWRTTKLFAKVYVVKTVTHIRSERSLVAMPLVATQLGQNWN